MAMMLLPPVYFEMLLMFGAVFNETVVGAPPRAAHGSPFGLNLVRKADDSVAFYVIFGRNGASVNGF